MVSLGFSALLPHCRFPVLKKLDEHQWMRTGKLGIAGSQVSLQMLLHKNQIRNSRTVLLYVGGWYIYDVVTVSQLVLSTLTLHLSKGTITKFTTKTLESHCSIRASFEYPCMFCTNNSEIGTRVIIGYWIGPDPEDGWGFVEAFLNEI